MKQSLPPSFALLTGALAFAAGCGGGGGGGGQGPVEPPLNQGSYTLADFDHVNSNPPGFDPLGARGLQVLRREELLAIIPGPDGESRSLRMQEGADADHSEIAGMAQLFQGTGGVHGAAGGQLDQDAESELVVATVDDLEAHLTLHRVERDGSGVLRRTPLRTIEAGAWPFEDVRVALGDLDGDSRDEIVVTARPADPHVAATHARIWVFDDPEDGGGELFSYERLGRHVDFEGLPIDVDGDGDAELAIGLSGDTTDDGRYAVRLYDHEPGDATLTLVHDWFYLSSDVAVESSRAVVGDFDADGREDLACVRIQWGSSWRLDAGLFEFASASGSWSQYAVHVEIDVSPPPRFGRERWNMTSFRPTLGSTDLAVALPDGLNYRYFTLHHERGLDRWTRRGALLTPPHPGNGLALLASDVDADGAEEVLFGFLHYRFSVPLGGDPGWLTLGVLEHGESLESVWQDPIYLGPTYADSGRSLLPVLVGADIDADGFALQHTGRRDLRLADPIPLVVLSAPPTVREISQNYGDTESAYSTGTTQGETIGVTTYTSVTGSAGAGFDLFGILGVAGRTSLQRSVERTSSTTRQETNVQGYRGAFDADVIVFQGTLYETYEYRIVGASDPAAIGTFVTLDIPVDANTYKWTVDYYNAQVAPADRIGTDVLTHTPGVIASYPDRRELADLLAGELHWDLAGSRPVGQGGASDFQVVSFERESATEEQRSLQRGYGGGVSFGIDVDIDLADAEGSTFGVVYGFETVFEASVGDIADPDDYEAWRYNWGFSIQTVGRHADLDNRPDGYDGRKHSFQYLRYWAEPTGSGY